MFQLNTKQRHNREGCEHDKRNVCRHDRRGTEPHHEVNHHDHNHDRRDDIHHDFAKPLIHAVGLVGDDWDGQVRRQFTAVAKLDDPLFRTAANVDDVGTRFHLNGNHVCGRFQIDVAITANSRGRVHVASSDAKPQVFQVNGIDSTA